jgi:hypothetical protein
MLASATGSVALTAGQSSWVDLFWAPVAVTAGQSYWVVIGNGPGNAYTLNGTSSTNYPAGGAYYNYSASATAGYTDFTQYDLAFRTYTNTAGVMSSVPEPGTWALLGTGLLGVAGVARRKRTA